MIVFKVLISAVLLAWVAGGFVVIAKYQQIFGPNSDHLSETPGARSFGVAQVAAVWVGGIALGIYFLVV